MANHNANAFALKPTLSFCPMERNTRQRTAIRQAIADAAADDVVLIAGKGHENYQILGTTRLHFDDVEEAQQALGRLQAA